MNQKICYGSTAEYWYRYMDTVVVVNLKDCMAQSLNGFDFDGDLLYTTNNKVLLRRQKNLLPIVCSQKTADKKIVTEDNLFKSNLQGFGSKIGHITNKITNMTNLMANYKPEDKEYQVLKYRTQCGQKLQQDAIDSAKGIKPLKMPTEWEKFSACRIKDSDSEDDIARKNFNMSICAEKYAYFFQYRYLSMKRDYDAYKNTANNTAIVKFNKTINEMKNCSNLTEEEAVFMDKYKNNCPMDESHGVQNRICWAVEREFDNFKTKKVDGISCLNVLNMSNINYDLYDAVKILCDDYKSEVHKQSKKYIKNNVTDGDAVKSSTDILNYYVSEMYKICSNEDELCDILIDICYIKGYNKEIVWTACGDVIASRLVMNGDEVLKYPKCINGTTAEAQFTCCGNKYIIDTIERGELYD